MPINPDFFKIDPTNLDDPHLQDFGHKYNSLAEKYGNSINEVRGDTPEDVEATRKIMDKTRSAFFWSKAHLKLNIYTSTLLLWLLTSLMQKLGVNTQQAAPLLNELVKAITGVH